MDFETATLRSFHELDHLYLGLLSDVKSGGPIWDDIINKGSKLFAALRATVHASNAFFDAIQRLADLASKTSGGSKEIGAHFTRLCMRQKRLGSQVKTMGNQLITCMVNPMTSHVDEWKKTITQIEKEHNRETKRARGELKRALAETNRLKRKLSKHGNGGTSHSRQHSASSSIGQGVGLGEPPKSNHMSSSTTGVGNSSLAVKTQSAVHVLDEKVRHIEDIERAFIKRLMIEERGRYCFFFNCLRPVLETETNLLGEVSTLRELFTALSTATEDPTRLLEDAESVLARAGVATGDSGVPVTPSGALHPSGSNEVEAFASAVDAIMSSRQQRQRQSKHLEGTLSLASDSLGSTSSGWSGSGNDADCPNSSLISSQVSIHSANSGPQHQMAAILRHSRLPQNDNGPRSASVGRPMVNEIPQRIVSVSGVKDLMLQHPMTNGHNLTSTLAHRPKTTAIEVQQSSGFSSVNGMSPIQPSPNQRHSTCTLHLNDTVSSNAEDRTLKNMTNGHSQEEENEEDDLEETASGTLDDETSDDGMLSDDRGLGNGDRREKMASTNNKIQRPGLNGVLSREQRSLSRGGELHKLYPDQSLPPPVYTNLNKLTHAAQRKFSMSTNVSPNTPTGGPAGNNMLWSQSATGESDNLSIASAPHVQPEMTTNNSGVHSMPGSPHRPSYSTSSSNSRPRGSSVGVEDPFSVEMDELDRMVIGSSVASSLTSQSGRSGTDPSMHSNSCHRRNSRAIHHSTGVPVGLLRASKSPDVNSLRRSRSRSSSFCASIAAATISRGDHENAAVLMNPPSPQCIPNLEPLNHWAPQRAGLMQAIIPGVDVEKHANQVSSTAASLLTQLSGQLQQLTTSNTAPLQKQPGPINGNGVHFQNESAEFDLPAPPSPDMLDVH
nr:metastasis suppressor protein 1 [Hymenolepis microstoma]